MARYADVLQVGARNMQNYRLLEAVGETDRPVLLKRGPSATIEELLLAAEYILERRQSERDALRARHPHVRNAHPLHAAAGHGASTCTPRRTCRSSSIPATARATPTWCRRWPPPASPPAPTA